MKDYICEDCGLVKESGTHIKKTTEVLPVRGEDVAIECDVRFCNACSKDISDEELDGATLLQGYAIYRERYNIITPEEIKAMREGYGLSQRALSALMGFGEISIHRYENGTLPDPAHAVFLRLVQGPKAMLELLGINGHLLTKQALKRATKAATGARRSQYKDSATST